MLKHQCLFKFESGWWCFEQERVFDSPRVMNVLYVCILQLGMLNICSILYLCVLYIAYCINMYYIFSLAHCFESVVNLTCSWAREGGLEISTHEGVRSAKKRSTKKVGSLKKVNVFLVLKKGLTNCYFLITFFFETLVKYFFSTGKLLFYTPNLTPSTTLC